MPSRPFDAPRSSLAWDEVEAKLAEAIRSSAGGQVKGNAEVFLAGLYAKHLTDHLALPASWSFGAPNEGPELWLQLPAAGSVPLANSERPQQSRRTGPGAN